MNTATPSCSLPVDPAGRQGPFKAVFGMLPVNGQALSLFRIFFSLLLLYDFFGNILPMWDFFMSAQGTLTAAERNTTMIWSLFTYSDNQVLHSILLCIYVLGILGFLIGYKTRLCCFVTLILYASIVDRNLTNASNVEILVRALLIWSCFLPMDRYWSVAAAFRKEKNRSKPWPAIPVLAMKMQIVIVYFYSGLFKLASPEWMSGTAIKYAVSDQFYGTALGRDLVAQIPDVLLHQMTYTVVVFQLCFSFLVYSPYRNDVLRGIVLFMAACMHIGFLVFLQVGIFPFLCFIYLVLLVPDRWIDSAFKRRRERLSHIRIYYDPDCGFCWKIARLLREFCLGPAVSVRPASDDPATLSLLQATNSWVVYGHDGQTYLKWNAVSYVLKQSPFFWIIGAITGSKILSAPMEKIYDLIGRNRHVLGHKFRFFLKGEEEQPPSMFAQYFCLLCLGVMVIYTTLVLPQINANVQLKISSAAYQLGVIQKWDLFAPYVTRWSWEFTVTGYDINERLIDISPVLNKHYRRGKDGYYVFDSHRVLKFYSRTFEQNESQNRRGLARYVCHMMAQRGTNLIKVSMSHSMGRNFDGEWKRDPLYSLYYCADVAGTP